MQAKTNIQEEFGRAVVDSIVKFARQDIPPIADLEAESFSHVKNQAVRGALARTMYGTRWLYKLGLALVVSGDESIAHVRVQVIDYGSICETLLKEMVGQGVKGQHLSGVVWKTSDLIGNGDMLPWATKFDRVLKRRKFEWLVAVAKEERMVSAELGARLDSLRKYRNTVHLTELASSRIGYVRSLAKDALETTLLTIRSTRKWAAVHP